jgi:hypothetical protein
VDLPNKAPPEELEPQQGHVRTYCPAPNRKRPSTCLVETGHTTASTRKQRGNATDSCSSMETDRGLNEVDPSPSRVTSSAVIVSAPDQEVVQEEATTESGQLAATKKRSSMEEVGGARDEEDSKPSLVTSSSLLVSSYPDQEDVQEEATTPDEIPSFKLEPDC